MVFIWFNRCLNETIVIATIGVFYAIFYIYGFR